MQPFLLSYQKEISTQWREIEDEQSCSSVRGGLELIKEIPLLSSLFDLPDSATSKLTSCPPPPLSPGDSGQSSCWHHHHPCVRLAENNIITKLIRSVWRESVLSFDWKNRYFYPGVLRTYHRFIVFPVITAGRHSPFVAVDAEDHW